MVNAARHDSRLIGSVCEHCDSPTHSCSYKIVLLYFEFWTKKKLVKKKLTDSCEVWYRKCKAVGSQSIAIWFAAKLKSVSQHKIVHPRQNLYHGHHAQSVPSRLTAFKTKGNS